jgi:FG-GAP-like repeat/Secretion system C-terminal sorting domain
MKVVKILNVIILSAILVAFIASNPRSGYKIPRQANVITAADLEVDGDTDLVVGHWFDSQTLWYGVTIMHNINNGIYSLFDSIYVNGDQQWIFAKKINNDNDPDIIGEFDSGYYTCAAVLIHNINGTYQEYHVPLGDRIYSLFPGDIDGNNSLDFVFISNFNYYWGVCYNNGQGAFTSPVHYNLTFPPTDITSGDLNQDAKEDIVIAGAYPKIAFSNSSGFQYQNLPVMFEQVHIADMDHNGTNDIIGIINFNFSRVYIIDGSQNFMYYTTTTLPFINDQSVVADLNNDTLPDLVLVPYPLIGLYILYNLGNNTFETPQFLSIPNEGESHRSICCADLDGNGYNDIAMVRGGGSNGYTFNNLLLFFNDGQGHFLPDPITYIPENKINKDVLLKAYPNPFHETITFDINVNTRSFTTLSIFDIRGQQIKRLLYNNLKGGQYLLSWNGLDDRNNNCLPGIYFACLNINREKILSKKIVKY